jgi:uncharacterized membrane protein
MKKKNVRFLYLLFKELNIKITATSIETESEKYPDFPEISCIVKMLKNWNLTSDGYELNFNELSQINYPCITYLFGELACIHNLQKDFVVISNGFWRRKKISIDEFEGLFNGFVLIVKRSEDSGESDYASKRREEIINFWSLPAAIVGLSSIVIVLFIRNQCFNTSAFYYLITVLIVKLVGVLVTSLLLGRLTNMQVPLMRRICGNNSCDKILDSKAAYLFKNLTWTEIGFFYFAGTFLALFYSCNDQYMLRNVAFLNTVSLPYTAFSLYYQFKIAKQWCLLCTAVQLLLWLEVIIFSKLVNNLEPHFENLWNLYCCLLLPVIIWIILKPYLLKLSQQQIFKQQLYQFKYTVSHFNTLIQQEYKHNLLDDSCSIILGPSDAIRTITLISNPFCTHCLKAHTALTKLVESNKTFKLQLLFCQSNDPTSILVLHHLILLNMQMITVVDEAIHNWFESTDLTAWVKRYPVEENVASHAILSLQSEWYRSIGVNYTPLILIDGRKLPDMYSADDIKYLI